jgi:D-glycero-alpha-D-manno-heptose-7-phosphate kinase
VIISRTPLRVSFFGGGTDYPDWFKKNNGSVISAAINKYSYINSRYLPNFFKHKHCIRYYLREEINSIKEIKHPSVRETLKFLNFKRGVEIIHNADLPARSGLGSSSSFTVGLLNSISALQERIISKRNLANKAIYIEQKKIKENVGSQDQIASAFGGFNKINFFQNGNFTVKPYILSGSNLNLLEESLALFFVGMPRTASNVAKYQISSINKRFIELNAMLDLVKDADIEFKRKRLDIKSIGKLLNEQWLLKKKLSNKITNLTIDSAYNFFMNSGAYGGKLCGAGAGGFMLICANKEKIRIMKKSKKFLHVPFNFDFTGSQIIYSSRKLNKLIF